MTSHNSFMQPYNPMAAFSMLPQSGVSSPNFGFMPGSDSMNNLIAQPTMDYAASMPTTIAADASGGGNWWDGMVGTPGAPGWGGLAVGAGSALMNGFMGMKQYGLAKDAFKQSKKQFQMNFDAQRKTTNSALEDRQRARVASNSGAYQSVGDYMKENRI